LVSFFSFEGILILQVLCLGIPGTRDYEQLLVSEGCCRGTPEHAKEQLIPGRNDILPVSPFLQSQLQLSVLASRLGSNASEYFALCQFTGKKSLCVHEHSATQKKQN